MVINKTIKPTCLIAFVLVYAEPEGFRKPRVIETEEEDDENESEIRTGMKSRNITGSTC